MARCSMGFRSPRRGRVAWPLSPIMQARPAPCRAGKVEAPHGPGAHAPRAGKHCTFSPRSAAWAADLPQDICRKGSQPAESWYKGGAAGPAARSGTVGADDPLPIWPAETLPTRGIPLRARAVGRPCRTPCATHRQIRRRWLARSGDEAQSIDGRCSKTPACSRKHAGAPRPMRDACTAGNRRGDAGWSSPVARQAHNLKVVGSNPTPATNLFNEFMAIIPCRSNCCWGSSRVPTRLRTPPTIVRRWTLRDPRIATSAGVDVGWNVNSAGPPPPAPAPCRVGRVSSSDARPPPAGGTRRTPSTEAVRALRPTAGHPRSCRRRPRATPAPPIPLPGQRRSQPAGLSGASGPPRPDCPGRVWPASVRVPTGTAGCRTPAGRCRLQARPAGCPNAAAAATGTGRARTAPCRPRATSRRPPRSSAPPVAQASRLDAPA